MFDPEPFTPDPSADPSDPAHPENMLAEGALEPEDQEHLTGRKRRGRHICDSDDDLYDDLAEYRDG